MNLQNLSLQSFIVKKPDGETRLILNLKELNRFVKCEHFKMNGVKAIINMVTRNCFMATIDLKDAYYILHLIYLSLFLKYHRHKSSDKTDESIAAKKEEAKSISRGPSFLIQQQVKADVVI